MESKIAIVLALDAKTNDIVGWFELFWRIAERIRRVEWMRILNTAVHKWYFIKKLQHIQSHPVYDYKAFRMNDTAAKGSKGNGSSYEY